MVIWGKKGVFLENGIQLSFVWRKGSDILAVKDDPALIGGLKAADEAQRRGLSSAGAEEREKLILTDIEIQIVQDHLAVVRIWKYAVNR